MENRINQPELSYSCGAGEAKVNLATGRLIFNHFDIKIGIDNYQVGIAHIYNSQMSIPDNFQPNVGRNWKLNVQQYLYQDGSKYIYIDEIGNKHEFLPLDETRYYDTSGLGLILTVISGSTEITDEVGNKMVFISGKLVRTVSTYNETDRIVKQFSYNINGNLESVYDNRTSNNCLYLNYDSSTGLLKTIKCLKNSTVIEEINYVYDGEKCLTKIIRKANGITKIDSLFSYTFNNLNQATYFEDKSTLRFSTTDGKVSYVKKGIASISINSSMSPLNYVGEDIFCNDNLYVGEMGKEISYSNSGGAQILGNDLISYSLFTYNPKNTIVSNEKNVKLIYYLNDKGMLTSVFELDESSDYFLYSLQKMPGVLMVGNGSNQNKINGQNVLSLSTSNIISTSGLLATKLEEIKEYRKIKYANFINYTCNFFLKMNEDLPNTKIKLIIKSKDSEGFTVEEYGYGNFDNEAVGSWQYVSIPITISKEEITYIVMKFVDLNDNQITINKQFYLADMRLCYTQHSRYFITDGVNVSSLSDVSEIIMTSVIDTEESINLTNDLFISPFDIELTYLNMFKTRGLLSSDNCFILSYCNGTKKKTVKNAKLCVYKDGYKEYQIYFKQIDPGKEGRAQAYSEIKSPDGSLTIQNYTHFCKNKSINSKSYDCIRKITSASRGNQGDQGYINTFIENYIDLKGKPIKQLDEYGVETIYEYGIYGDISKKIIQNQANLNEKLTFTASSYSTHTETNDYKSMISSYFNEPLGNIEVVKYKGLGESDNNLLTTSYTYDNFNDKLISVTNNLDGSNYFRYHSNKLLEVTPIGWKSDKAYGYKIDYDELGNPNKYNLSYKDGNNWGQDLLLEKDENIVDGVITTKQHRGTFTDITEVHLDKYGRLSKVKEDGKTTFFSSQVLSESSIASKIEEINDPFENRTYHFNFDDFNNLTGYEVKYNNGALEYSIKAEGVDKIKYLGVSLSPNRFVDTEVIKDENKILRPRITNTKTYYSSYINETVFEYDDLGRLKKKETLPIGPYTKFTDNITYKPNTLLKQNIKTIIDFSGNSDIEYDFYNGYDSRGNLSIKELKQTFGTSSSITMSSAFNYDKANRLISESNSALGIINKTYTYNKDGTLQSETQGSITRCYAYDKGRLTHFYNTSDSGNKTYFSYDNYGNCTHYKREQSLSANLKWTRGNLLKEHIGTNTTTYYYNIHGVRFRKDSSNGKITSYFLDGSKIIGEYFNDGNEITYLYDSEGIKGFIEWSNGTTYHYIKDVLGNVVSIVSGVNEVAHYEYDAWGNCTITKDFNGIGTLNPFRWKSHYYDNESGFYYIDGRYYSPEIKSFVSSCNIDEILYNISIHGGLNLYAIGNPMYFSMNRFNIFTTIPLAPENIGSEVESDFWRFLGSIVRFVGGAIITVGGAILTYKSAPLFLVPGLSIIPQFGITMTMYGASMMASSWDSQIKEDMDRIGWNPFNSNEEAVLKSKYISFYKGSAVIRHSVPKTTSCSIGGVIFLNRNTSSVMDLKHEWGHTVQSWLLGARYIPLIAIPSVINYLRNVEGKLKYDYYWYPWESTADWLGGVVR